jgi:hypothetical protein
MSIFSNKNLFNTHLFYLAAIFIFSFIINFYYSKFGVFPIDTFLHYDSAYRMLNNEYPIRDYWVVSGLTVDFLQFLFFKVLGVNWFAYTFHSSIFNAIISLLSYYFFVSLKISKIKSFIYSLSFAILAYTISGTPFVDHHATFFSLTATYLTIIAFSDPQKKIIWSFIILLFLLGFLSKQVPTTYVAITQGLIALCFLIKKKSFNIIKISLISFVGFIGFFLIILIYLKIEPKNFYLQYLHYPQYIGSDRFSYLSKSIGSLFNHYKFLFLPIIIILIFKFMKIKNKKINFFSNEIFNLLLLLAFCFSLIFHQMMTKNQIFIYFLIPIFFAIAESDIQNSKLKYKKYLSIFLIFFLTIVTVKYHLRYNETRKFHELERVDLKKALSAEKIDKSLKGLNWITPFFDKNPSNELMILKKVKNRINNINYEIMFITHYLFLDSITEKKLNYPSRTFTVDGASMPNDKSKFFFQYKNFLIKKIQKKNIKEVYFLKHEKISKKIITAYLSEKCYNFREDDLFYIYKINCLK